MASAKIKKKIEKIVQLTLSEDEAYALNSILWNIGGVGTITRKFGKDLDGILCALNNSGITYDNNSPFIDPPTLKSKA